MEHCIRSLLPGGDRVEILIIDDGSTDATAQIADRLAFRFPGLIRVIHQENKGHGGAVNTGIREARCRYFKVVDSDDWVDEDAYMAILDTLEGMTGRRQQVDMFLSNFVYEKTGARRKKTVHFHRVLPENKVFGWSEVQKFRVDQYILMHSVIYRTKLLRDCGLQLPEHTFYVDNIFVYTPLPYVKKMYYLNVDFYRYFIGRQDQSINEQVMLSRLDQQLRVNRILLDVYDPFAFGNIPLRKYLLKYLNLMVMVTCSLLIIEGSDKSFAVKKKYWHYIRRKYPRVYRSMILHIWGIIFDTPGRFLNRPIRLIYRIANKIIGFN